MYHLWFTHHPKHWVNVLLFKMYVLGMLDKSRSKATPVLLQPRHSGKGKTAGPEDGQRCQGLTTGGHWGAVPGADDRRAPGSAAG